MYTRVLVPLDGSEASEVVLPYVVEIAAGSAAEVILVIVSEFAGMRMNRIYNPYLEQAATDVEDQLEKWDAKAGAKVRHDVLVGKPASEILRYADESDVSLVAMVSRGSSDTGPWLLGDIAAKVIRATSKPVLLVRSPASNAALQRKSLIKRVLIPLDGSKLGEAAIPRVEALAKSLDIELVLLHVSEPVIIADVPGLASITIPRSKEEASRMASASDYLNNCETTLREEGLSVSIELRSGSAADQIIDYAEAEGIDLIAMSTHGRSGIGRWVFGSVADKVLHAGNTPLLLVRASGVNAVQRIQY